jgi:antitoxin VapB
MSHVAKLFIHGQNQAVCLPAAYRLDAKEVFIRQDPDTGDIILSRKPANWDGFFAALNGVVVPDDFLAEKERSPSQHDRDPFEGWRE